jgi:hypothetical protein
MGADDANARRWRMVPSTPAFFQRAKRRIKFYCKSSTTICYIVDFIMLFKTAIGHAIALDQVTAVISRSTGLAIWPAAQRDRLPVP